MLSSKRPQTAYCLLSLLGTIWIAGLLNARDAQSGAVAAEAVAAGSDGNTLAAVYRPDGTPDARGTMPGVGPNTRVIVKLRDPMAQRFAGALPKGTSGAKLMLESATDSQAAGLLRRHGARKAEALSRSHVDGRWRRDRSAKQAMAEVSRRFSRRAARAPAEADVPDFSGTYVLELEARAPEAAITAIDALRKDPDVLYAEPDKIVRVQYVPNDPSYSSVGSWGQGYADLHGLHAIDAAQAWDSSQGVGVVVAVVDTGIDYNHPDIAANIWMNPREVAGNGIDDDGNGFIDDIRGWDFAGANQAAPVEDNNPLDLNGHGTHVAGTVAAVGDNNLGVVGVAWRAKVMAVKGLDDAGHGNDSQLARAIIYAADNGADVINASFGGEGESATIADAIRYAHGLGVVVVAAAGNDGADAAGYYPANTPETIVVSAWDVDLFGIRAFFSNFGSAVDLAAPGVAILSLKAGTGDYTRMDGTSMAAPHVSGVAALILACHPSFTNEQVRQAMRTSADDMLQPGRDSDSGYGRVNAARSVEIAPVLAARILSPSVGLGVSGPVTITGTVGGDGLDHYVVEYGIGVAPEQWIALSTGTASVTRGPIGSFDPATLPEGPSVVRLRAYDRSGKVFGDQVEIKIRYLEFTNPSPPRFPSTSSVVKPGVELALSGSARGGAFQSYRLEWAPGAAAESGWSTAGITLSNDGRVAVERGPLGSWTPPGVAQGYCTIRMTVVDGAIQRTAKTSVYLEPALVSGAWPRYVPSLKSGNNPVPVRQPDGSSRIVVTVGLMGWDLGRPDPTKVCLYSTDGTVVTSDLSRGSGVQPAVGDIDGVPGDEIVVPDGTMLRVFASNLAPLRTISESVNDDFSLERVVLADLDGDGLRELLAVSRDFPDDVMRRTLRAYRGNGSVFAGQAPITFRGNSTGELRVVAVDLDGDERKEIIAAVMDPGGARYQVDAFRADGAPYEAWETRLREGMQCEGLVAADLDGDGTIELIVTEFDSAAQHDQIRVINCAGSDRNGWPVSCGADGGKGSLHVSVGDVDRDGGMEIVAATNTQLYVFRDDGSWWNDPQPMGDGTPFNLNSTPLIADADGDGAPEIIVGRGSFLSEGKYLVASVGSYTNHGVLKQSWPLFGMEGQQPHWGVPAVADLSGTGRADLLVSTPTVFGGTENGSMFDSTVTLLATGGTWSPAYGDWIMAQCDAQGSCAIPQRAQAPVIAGQPGNQVGAEDGAVAFTVVAHAYPRPTFQWFKDGAAISGATSSTCSIAKVAPGDAGIYTVVVQNRLGRAESAPAALNIGITYAAWARNHGLAADSGYADFDGDGLANLAEFALLRNPLLSDPQSGTELIDVAERKVFRFQRPQSIMGVTYKVQVSTDLQHWETAPGTPEVTDAGGGVETVTVTLGPVVSMRFARLVITPH